MYKRTNTGISRITAQSICHIAGVDTITSDPWNIECVLVTHTFTWSPSIRRLWISFCLTLKRYTLAYSNFIFTCKFNNLGGVCKLNIARRRNNIIIYNCADIVKPGLESGWSLEYGLWTLDFKK